MSFPDYSYVGGPQRWFNGGPRRLWGLLMMSACLIGGMFLGRFLTQSEHASTVTRLKADLALRDSELAPLRQDSRQLQEKSKALAHLASQYEAMRYQHEQVVEALARAEDSLSSRQKEIGRALEFVESDRRRCLTELDQANRMVPVDTVRNFAQIVFAARREELARLQSNQSRAENPSDVTVRPAHQSFGFDAEVGPAIVADTEEEAVEETFFGPLPKRPTSYTYFSRRDHASIADAPRPRMVFSDSRPESGGAVFR